MTEWGSKNAVKKPTAFYTRERKEMMDETRFGNIELKAIRHRKLKMFYESNYINWCDQLASKGLAPSSY